MCRVYEAKAGWYVRLCYYHKERKGEHIPVPRGFELEGTHYPKQSSVRRSPASARNTAKTQIERCIYCGCPLSRHNTTGVCTLCTEHPPKELEPWNY